MVEVLAAARDAEPGLNSAALATLAQQRLGLHVHPRSVERALQRRGKGGRPES